MVTHRGEEASKLGLPIFYETASALCQLHALGDAINQTRHSPSNASGTAEIGLGPGQSEGKNMSETGPPATPGERDSMPVCATCGSHLVMRDAWAIWKPIKASWELGAVFDATFCDQCGGETSLKWLVLSDWRTLRIRALNDDLRKGEPGLNDRFVVTRGVAEKAEAFLALTMQVVADFSDFTAENDPNGEHDFGMVDVEGERLYFKVDYYTPDLQGGSEDPSEPACTARVLTIMLAAEY